jgi:hypothetical protein
MKTFPLGRIVAIVLGFALLSTLPAGEPDTQWITKQADRLRAGDTDAWRKIPWAKSLSAAASTARTEGRHLFIFTHDGNIDTGRC